MPKKPPVDPLVAELAELNRRHGSRELARRAGVSRQAIEQWVAGLHVPRAKSLERLRASFEQKEASNRRLEPAQARAKSITSARSRSSAEPGPGEFGKNLVDPLSGVPLCQSCKGVGGHFEEPGQRGWRKCTACNGTGHPPPPIPATENVLRLDIEGPVVGVTDPTDARSTAQDTVDRLWRALSRLEGDKHATSREVAAVATSLTSATRLLARLTGSMEVSESQVVRSPAMRRVLAVMLDVLRAELPGRPDVAKKLQEAVHKLDTEGR